MVTIKSVAYSLLAYGTLSAALPHQKREGLFQCFQDSDCQENYHCQVHANLGMLAPAWSYCVTDTQEETRAVETADVEEKRDGLNWCVLDSDCGENQRCYHITQPTTFAPPISYCVLNTQETKAVKTAKVEQ